MVSNPKLSNIWPPGIKQFMKSRSLEGILDSPSGHQGFSNLRKAGPLEVFSSLYLAIRDLAIYEKQIH